MNECWSDKVKEIYKKALDDLSGDIFPLHFGPAHVVWEDDNLDFAQSCLDDFDEFRGDYKDWQLEIVRGSLVELADIPESELWIDEEDEG